MLEIKNLSKTFGNNRVLDNINLDLQTGKLYTFLGPSGCGKTTILRIIAGLESGDPGYKLFYEGEDFTKISPAKRDIGFVFQNYALFPHLTVRENIAYGLKAHKLDNKQIQERVQYILDVTKLDDQKDKNIGQLSGGQAQRVAIARSLVMLPKILLLDEPMSNLDAALKDSLLEFLMDIQSSLGLTTIYVTHDQREAMLISDEIILFDEGTVSQRGTSIELYNQPENVFVASFIGENNIFPGKIWNKMICRNMFNNEDSISLRDEHIHLIQLEQSFIPLKGIVNRKRFYGPYAIITINIDDIAMIDAFISGADLSESYDVQEEDPITIYIDSNNFQELGELDEG